MLLSSGTKPFFPSSPKISWKMSPRSSMSMSSVAALTCSSVAIRSSWPSAPRTTDVPSSSLALVRLRSTACSAVPASLPIRPAELSVPTAADVPSRDMPAAIAAGAAVLSDSPSWPKSRIWNLNWVLASTLAIRPIFSWVVPSMPAAMLLNVTPKTSPTCSGAPRVTLARRCTIVVPARAACSSSPAEPRAYSISSTSCSVARLSRLRPTWRAVATARPTAASRSPSCAVMTVRR